MSVVNRTAAAPSLHHQPCLPTDSEFIVTQAKVAEQLAKLLMDGFVRETFRHTAYTTTVRLLPPACLLANILAGSVTFNISDCLLGRKLSV